MPTIHKYLNNLSNFLSICPAKQSLAVRWVPKQDLGNQRKNRNPKTENRKPSYPAKASNLSLKLFSNSSNFSNSSALMVDFIRIRAPSSSSSRTW